MKRGIARIVLSLLGTVTLMGCQQPPDKEAVIESKPFSHLSELDIVEMVPTRAPDARVRYDEHPLTFGNLRLPDGATGKDSPLVILIHGGQWESSFTLDYMEPLAEALTEAGVATWNIEFRRLNNPGGGYPGMFHDVSNGIDFARQLAQNYPIDAERIVLLGHSSGGHLAAWAAGRQNLPQDSELLDSDPLPVRGIVDLAGVLDLEYAYSAGRTDILEVVGVGNGEELGRLATEVSPIELFPRGIPQTLVIGSDDSPWRLESQERYKTRGETEGDVLDLIVLDGANHFDVVDPCTEAWTPIATAVFEYLDESLDSAESSNPVCAR
ncbi:alpha/beta hydrolase [Leucobacter tenebrionis]|uniref:alpha/beta hydrolase n=1 Tax=Leucobacter tenebrionis TaxID=2873270 RepID=UPI001CA78048|nr:alpha/beta hydrolase [Leucobacter tenebrionis]QZY50720.1 alpha/beta hydrolase [Leucobacter tenebrionis]